MVKGRAEVNEWNEAGRNNDPVGGVVIATDSGSTAAYVVSDTCDRSSTSLLATADEVLE
jgi:hypothetical protein